MCRPRREVSGPIRMLVALVREEVVLFCRERDVAMVVDGFQVTRRRGVDRVDLTSGGLFRVDVPMQNTST